MIWFKDCPRCGGDRYASDEGYGCEKVCIQCGYRAEPCDKTGRPGIAAFSGARPGNVIQIA